MNSSRIEVPLTLPTPHFDDERTVATARQVKPIGRARVTENWRTVRTLLPLILLAMVCGALGAAGVNYYENRHTVNAIAQPSTSNTTAESKVEASPVAVAASASPTPNLADKTSENEPADAKIEATPTERPETKIVTQPARDEQTEKPDASEKKTTNADAAKLTRKRRVNPSDDEAVPSNKKGAGRIADIFGGPNP